jgi:hypothetical protein
MTSSGSLLYVLLLLLLQLLHQQVVQGANIVSTRYPSASRTMQDLNILLTLLEMGIPFGFAHFNDGEIWLINVDNCDKDKATGQPVADYGWQNCSTGLATAMKNALINTAPNFYVGIPCACEWHGTRTVVALEYLGLKPSKPIPYTCSFDQHNGPMTGIRFDQSKVAKPWLKDRLTVATTFINGNKQYAYNTMTTLLQEIGRDGNRTVHVVVGHGAFVENLPFKHNTIFAAEFHAFEHNYTTIRTMDFINRTFKKNDVVLIMLGPLGRILASEWTLLSSEITFIDLGSFFDDHIRHRQFSNANHLPCNYNGDFKANEVPNRHIHPIGRQ